jgi:hypothetical protein
MIKIILILGLASLLAAPASYTVLKLPDGQAPEIDGNISEWPQAYFIDSLHSDDNVYARDGGEWTRDDYQMGLYVAWDDQKVYFAVKIINDDVLITTGQGVWQIDNIKVNPGGQAMAFYIGIDGTIITNPSSPYIPGTNAWMAMDPNGNDPFPTYEFAIQRDLLDPFHMNMYQISVGSEENDAPSYGDLMMLAVGAEYTGNKQDWNGSGWDNPLYYPTYALAASEGPAMSTQPQPPRLVPITSPFFNQRPTFQWYPVADADFYTIQVDTTLSFTSPLLDVTTTATFFTPLNELPTDTIYWRVESDAASGLFSEVGMFVLFDKYIPVLIPVEPSPVQDTRPTFRWHSVDSVSQYIIVIDDNEDFSSLIIGTVVNDTVFTPSMDLPNGTIYWKVKSVNSNNYSAHQSFFIQPSRLPFLYAYNGNTVTDTSVVFKWRPVTGADYYRLQVSQSMDFTDFTLILNIEDTVFTPLARMESGKYYWRVSTSDSISYFSPADSFIVAFTPSIERTSLVADAAMLRACPNPFKPATAISYNARHGGCLKIFNINGKLVRDFGHVTGLGKVIWDGADTWGVRLASGIYIVQLRSKNKVSHVKLLLKK